MKTEYKTIIILMTQVLLCLVILPGCNHSQNPRKANADDAAFRFTHEPSNAVYHWKTEFRPNSYELDFLKKHHVKRLYVRFFDVGTDNLYDGNGEQPVPIATTVFGDNEGLYESTEIVPVVFITVEALRLGKPLTERIVRRVDDMCKANHIPYKELQLDCDWTKETRDSFFIICKDAKSMLHKNRKGLSATVRLHQLRDTLPDIDYGVLMLYNTESLQNPRVKNSILTSKAVKEYMSHAKSDKHLDFAYPTYEWTLWFKDKKFMGILPQGDTPEITGELRYEQSEMKEIMETKRILKRELKDISYPSSTIIYHLDSTNLSKYRDDEIEKIYSR